MTAMCFAAVLWNVYGECENYAVMKGHTGAIMELHYSADGRCVLMVIAFALVIHDDREQKF